MQSELLVGLFAFLLFLVLLIPVIFLFKKFTKNTTLENSKFILFCSIAISLNLTSLIGGLLNPAYASSKSHRLCLPPVGEKNIAYDIALTSYDYCLKK